MSAPCYESKVGKVKKGIFNAPNPQRKTLHQVALPSLS